MRSIEVTLWQDEREYRALQAILTRNGTTVEAEMQERLTELYRQTVPEAERQRIHDTIQAEEIEEAQRREAAQPISVFHITERGQEHWLQQRERTEFLHAAISLRRYLTADPSDRAASFADTLSKTDSITPEQFRRLALERMENTGRVTGTVEVDLDSGEFSALHIMDGWKTYSVRDVSAAAHRATQKTYASSDERWERFLDRLEGRELTAGAPEPMEVQGTRRLRPEDVCFEGSIEEMDGALNFYLRCQFSVDDVFGTHVETDANDDYLNVYANYDMAAGEVRDELEITLCRGDGSDVQLVYKLDEDERAALLDKMRGYCQRQTGQSLEEYAASFQLDGPAEPQMQM